MRGEQEVRDERGKCSGMRRNYLLEAFRNVLFYTAFFGRFRFQIADRSKIQQVIFRVVSVCFVMSLEFTPAPPSVRPAHT